MTASLRFDFYRKLGSSWEDLADACDVPPWERRLFAQDRNPPRRVLEWLIERGAVEKLREGLLLAQRDDLFELAEHIISEMHPATLRTQLVALPKVIRYFEILVFMDNADNMLVDALERATQALNSHALIHATDYQLSIVRVRRALLATTYGSEDLAASSKDATQHTLLVLLNSEITDSLYADLAELLSGQIARLFVVEVNPSTDSELPQERRINLLQEKYARGASWFMNIDPDIQSVTLIFMSILGRIAIEISQHDSAHILPYSERR